MPDTLEAVGVGLLAILPGALYTWALEREIGQWSLGAADRLWRFVGMSAFFLAVFFPALHLLYRNFIHVPVQQGDRAFYVNLIIAGEPLPWWLYLVPLAYVAVPTAFGLLVAHGVRKGSRWVRVFVGRDPAPRAWDHVFSSQPSALVRVRLKDGSWAGGFFGADSYAAGYPEEPQDLYLETAYRVRSDGSFFVRNGDPVELGSGILIRWEEMQALELFSLEEAEESDGG